jgi:hypothetical protein
MIKLKIVLLGCLLTISSFLMAQQEVGLHFMQGVWQSVNTNPAFVPESNWVVSLPSIRNNLGITGATYNDIIFEEVDGKSQIDIGRLIDNLNDQNLIRDDLSIETIGVAFKVGRLTLSASHAFKYLAYLDYPKTLPQLIWQGNGQFIGEEVSIGNDLQFTGYNEFAVGASMKLNKLTLGGRAKYLTGIENVSTDDTRNTASFYTDPDIYQLTLTSDYLLNSAGSFQYNNYDDFNFNFNFGKARTDILFTQNSGFAIDLGAKLEVGSFEFAASVIDLGAKINWKEEVRNYNTAGTFEYGGLDFSDALTGEAVNFDQALDTLETIFEVTETNTDYSTDLPTKVYLSATMKLANMRIGGLFFTESYRGKTYPAFALGANANIFKIINIGGTYTILPELDSYANVGLNVSAKIGLVQAFATTDDIVAAFRPGESQTFGARVGINLLFGKEE